MAYFFIFLAIAVVAGPLLSVLPNRRQRDLEAARDAARSAGVTVGVRPPEGIPPRLRRATDNTLACYSIHLPRRKSRPLSRDMFVLTPTGWESRSGDPVPELLDSLPKGAEVVIIGYDDIRVYWDERGGIDAVETVIQSLLELRPKPVSSDE